MKDTLKIGLLGLGTVGTGVLTLLKEHQEKISQVTGMNVVIEKALDIRLEKGSCSVFSQQMIFIRKILLTVLFLFVYFQKAVV